MADQWPPPWGTCIDSPLQKAVNRSHNVVQLMVVMSFVTLWREMPVELYFLLQQFLHWFKNMHSTRHIPYCVWGPIVKPARLLGFSLWPENLNNSVWSPEDGDSMVSVRCYIRVNRSVDVSPGCAPLQTHRVVNAELSVHSQVSTAFCFERPIQAGSKTWEVMKSYKKGYMPEHHFQPQAWASWWEIAGCQRLCMFCAYSLS